MAAATLDSKRYLGCSPDRLSIDERHAALGKWVALQIYTPKTLPIRRIEAFGDSPAECSRQLSSRGLDPRDFEFQVLGPSY